MPLLAVVMAVGLGLAPAAATPTPTLSFVSKAALRMVDPRPRGGGSTPKKSFEGGTVVR